MAALGSVPERAAVGNGTRGLQRWGDAWSYFTHDQARSRAYRWGEDGLAGFSDDHQRLCLALALWNGRDPILKERLFGLTNSEGNHGEDVKEYYFYLDATPTSSYLKMLYKYPQAEFPYDDLVATNRRRGRRPNPSTSCWTPGCSTRTATSTSQVEYAKVTPEDILMQITVHNRGPDDCRVARAAHPVVPAHLVVGRRDAHALVCESSPTFRAERRGSRTPRVGTRWFYCDQDRSGAGHRERDQQRAVVRNAQRYDLCQRWNRPRSSCTATTRAVNPEGWGTKAAFHAKFVVPAAGRVTCVFG